MVEKIFNSISISNYLFFNSFFILLLLTLLLTLKIQFGIILIHSLVNIYTECSYPKGFSWAFVIYGVVITLLFLNFYSKSYGSSENSKKNKTNGHLSASKKRSD